MPRRIHRGFDPFVGKTPAEMLEIAKQLIAKPTMATDDKEIPEDDDKEIKQ